MARENIQHNIGNPRQWDDLGNRPQAAGDGGWGRIRGQEGRSYQRGAPYDNRGQSDWVRSNIIPPVEDRGMLLGDILRQAPQYNANPTPYQSTPTWNHIVQPPTHTYESKEQNIGGYQPPQGPNGAFVQAMSQITSNPTSANQGTESHIVRAVREFGGRQQIEWLAEVVIDLYEASLREATRRTYKTGQRAYNRFITSLAHGVQFPFQRTTLTDTELNLAFYMADLLLKPKITSAGTILNYETHVKSLFIEEGCEE